MSDRQSDESERFDRRGYAQLSREGKLVKGETDNTEESTEQEDSRVCGEQCSSERESGAAQRGMRRRFYWNR